MGKKVELTEQYAYRRLRESGAHFNGKVVKIKSGSIGIKLLGMADFLQSRCGYTIRYIRDEEE